MLLFAGCLAGLVAFILLPNANSLFQVLVPMALIGLGMGVGNPAAAAFIADTTCMTRCGEEYSTLPECSGVVVGPLVAGLTAIGFILKMDPVADKTEMRNKRAMDRYSE